MLRQNDIALKVRAQLVEQLSGANRIGPRLDRPMRQKVLLGRILCTQLGNLPIERAELDAQPLRFCLTAPVVFEAREPGELGQQRFMFSAGMLLEPALTHPADVAFFLGPVPRRITYQLGGGQYLGDDIVDRLSAFQQRSGDLHLCLVDRGVAGTLVTHRGEPRLNIDRSGALPGIDGKWLASAVALFWAPRQ